MAKRVQKQHDNFTSSRHKNVEGATIIYIMWKNRLLWFFDKVFTRLYMNTCTGMIISLSFFYLYEAFIVEIFNLYTPSHVLLMSWAKYLHFEKYLHFKKTARSTGEEINCALLAHLTIDINISLRCDSFAGWKTKIRGINSYYVLK